MGFACRVSGLGSSSALGTPVGCGEQGLCAASQGLELRLRTGVSLDMETPRNDSDASCLSALDTDPVS